MYRYNRRYPLSSDWNYGGSRYKNHRYEYSENSDCAFVELHPSHVITPGQLFQRLEAVPGVSRVYWNSTQTRQANVCPQPSERNILVHSSMCGPGSASRALEFEVTRTNHFQDERVPYTVTICFKKPPEGMLPEGWRILRAVTQGQELVPNKVDQYQKSHLNRWRARSESRAPDSVSAKGASADTTVSSKKAKLHSSGEVPQGGVGGAPSQNHQQTTAQQAMADVGPSSTCLTPGLVGGETPMSGWIDNQVMAEPDAQPDYSAPSSSSSSS
jgi:hypothetical protein